MFKRKYFSVLSKMQYIIFLLLIQSQLVPRILHVCVIFNIEQDSFMWPVIESGWK